MIEYEWARLGDGRFIAYCHDTLYNKKMIAIGGSHNAICRNFAMMLFNNKISSRINERRFLQAVESNPELIDKYGNIKRGKILYNEDDIVTIKEKREIAKQEKADKEKLAESLIELDNIEKQFDSFMHRVDDEGNICIYGVKLIKK